MGTRSLRCFRHCLLRHSRHPNRFFYNQMQIHQTPLHTDTDFLEGGGDRIPDSPPYFHCLMWYLCATAASTRPSPTHPALTAHSGWLSWVLMAFAGGGQGVHLRISKLFQTHCSIPLCYSGVGNVAPFPSAQQMQSQELEHSFKPLL